MTAGRRLERNVEDLIDHRLGLIAMGDQFEVLDSPTDRRHRVPYLHQSGEVPPLLAPSMGDDLLAIALGDEYSAEFRRPFQQPLVAPFPRPIVFRREYTQIATPQPTRNRSRHVLIEVVL